MNRLQGTYIKRADTWRARLQCEDLDGQPIDLTGCSADMALIADDGTEVLRASTETGELTLIASGELHLAAELNRLLGETAALTETDADPTLVADLDQHLRDARETSVTIAESIPLDRLDTLQLEVPAATMALMTPATYQADVEIRWADGAVLSSPSFLVIVLPDQTQ